MARTASAPIRPPAPITATVMSRVVPALPVLLAASLTRLSVTTATPGDRAAWHTDSSLTMR